jgi:FLVCR family feline leukemia virus subgroup C receptor-related protein
MLINLLIFEAALVTVLLLPALLIFRDKPKTPPSYTASIKRESYKIALNKLIRMKSYICLMITFSIYYGTLTVLAAILSTLLGPFGITTQ